MKSVESDAQMKIQQPAIMKESSNQSQKQQQYQSNVAVVDLSAPLKAQNNASTAVQEVSDNNKQSSHFDDQKMKQIVVEMENRRKNWLKDYKTKLDLNDVLEIRNPQSVIEFIPEIIENMKIDEVKHQYPSNFLDQSF